LRAEDKELEGPELEREPRLEEEHVRAEEPELPILAEQEVVDIELVHRSRLFDALELILAEAHVEIGQLQLPEREMHALEFLQAAVSGRDELGTFVYAEDRRNLLEQSLAILQANITHGDATKLSELHAKFDTMSERVATLRAELSSLEDAQDELFAQDREGAKAEASDTADKPGDKPAKKPDKESLGFISRALNAISGRSNDNASLYDGPEAKHEPKPSTLSGPDVPDKPKPASTLAGPDVPVPARPASTLSGPDRAEPAKPGSTLDGPEPKPAAKPPSIYEPEPKR
jgi:hypothetical protein